MDNLIYGIVATCLFGLIGLVWRNVDSAIMEIRTRQEVIRGRIEILERAIEVYKSVQLNDSRRHEDNRGYMKERFDQLEELISLKVDQAFIKKQSRSSANS